MRTLVTAGSKEELRMRVMDLRAKGFKVIKRYKPQHSYTSGFIPTLSHNKYDSSKKKYESSTGHVKYRVLMERLEPNQLVDVAHAKPRVAWIK